MDAPGTTPNVTQHWGWQASPTDRGTFDILQSCVLTLATCVWTILHLDIPSSSSSPSSRFFRKVEWMLLAALAPEYITRVDMDQYLRARYHTKRMRQRNPSWSSILSFYIIMGAIDIDTSGTAIDASRVQDWIDRGQFHLSNLSEEDICDRSKADSFMKIIACVQTAWLLLQCLGRVAQRLPITTLELTTASFVIFTLATYVFW